jgi:hypothetical protein
MADNIKITMEERSAPQLRKLARALLSLVQRQALEAEQHTQPEGAARPTTPGASS